MNDERILFVDDNPDNVALTEVLLQSEGYTLHSAEDAEQALDILQIYHPDLILMDIQLPGMDGLELTRRIRKIPRFQNTFIIAFTAYAMPADETKARKAGCDGYIVKPIDTRTFPRLIRDYLSRMHLRNSGVN